MQIWYHEKSVGNWEAKQEGLYLRIAGKVFDRKCEICRLAMVWRGGKIPLGVMMPRGNEMYLEKKLPKKMVPENVTAILEPAGETFFPVASDTPFAVPENLLQGKYEKWGELYGISISNSTGQ